MVSFHLFYLHLDLLGELYPLPYKLCLALLHLLVILRHLILLLIQFQNKLAVLLPEALDRLVLLLDLLTLLLICLAQLSLLSFKSANGPLLFALFLFKKQVDLLLRLELKPQVINGQYRLSFTFSTLRLLRVCLGSLAQVLSKFVHYIHLDLCQSFFGFLLQFLKTLNLLIFQPQQLVLVLNGRL